MNNIAIGQYLPYDTFIHRLDPRVKLVCSLLFIITIFFVEDFIGYIPFVIILALMIWVGKIPVKSLVKSIKPLIWILLITGLINLFTTEGKELFTIFSLTATYEGLYKTVFMFIRIIMIVVSTSVLTFTTSPMELTDGLEKLFGPLKRFGFPAGELAMMVSISLRFIPTLFEEAQRIKMAQMARGADFESGNIVNRAKNMIPLLVPLFINSFKRSDDLATAMEARLYRIGRRRTRLNEIKMSNIDYVVLISFIVFCAIVIAIYFI
ncbi:energy-coupling factor transporter transmembrane protein EcfT [Anaerococcus sp. AGMB00486]|uniref:Energy-coupling factor transporter transmembrane protein EcfT n=2 Tax=Anaerococcus TaxID=165779 RepID=A0ABX2N871_9FIRM|nr:MULTISPECIES: energy-coupling factor transporter transmembrane component T [Anaerococcus]MSS77319.1 energy-coupling factor transporter transmembrane protein EcfT [Anaerococcus porci]NVF10879.1 energy-coupling factor transporter transmembrane protein EcfT [Anaerococcus faecalis]